MSTRNTAKADKRANPRPQNTSPFFSTRTISIRAYYTHWNVVMIRVKLAEQKTRLRTFGFCGDRDIDDLPDQQNTVLSF